MSKTIINLSIPLIIEEIESALDRRHYHPYRQAYANPELRQKLIAFVLNMVPTCYGLVEDAEANVANRNLIPHTLHHRLQEAVAEGICQVLEENADWVSHHIPPEQNPAFAPSNWFG